MAKFRYFLPHKMVKKINLLKFSTLECLHRTKNSHSSNLNDFFVLGHLEVFKLLYQEHEKRNIDFINATDMMGMTLLHFAAMNKKPNNVEILKILLQKSPNVNSIARDNTIPLDYAATTGTQI